MGTCILNEGKGRIGAINVFLGYLIHICPFFSVYEVHPLFVFFQPACNNRIQGMTILRENQRKQTNTRINKLKRNSRNCIPPVKLLLIYSIQPPCPQAKHPPLPKDRQHCCVLCLRLFSTLSRFCFPIADLCDGLIGSVGARTQLHRQL